MSKDNRAWTDIAEGILSCLRPVSAAWQGVAPARPPARPAVVTPLHRPGLPSPPVSLTTSAHPQLSPPQAGQTGQKIKRLKSHHSNIKFKVVSIIFPVKQPIFLTVKLTVSRKINNHIDDKFST